MSEDKKVSQFLALFDAGMDVDVDLKEDGRISYTFSWPERLGPLVVPFLTSLTSEDLWHIVETIGGEDFEKETGPAARNKKRKRRRKK